MQKRSTITVPIDLIWIQKESEKEPRDWKIATPEKDFTVQFDEQVSKGNNRLKIANESNEYFKFNAQLF